MPWKFGSTENPEAVTTNPEVVTKPPEKTQAELLAEAVGPIVASIQGIATKVEALETRFTAKPIEHTEQTPRQFTSVFDNEDAAIGERVVAAIGPVVQQQLEFQASVNLDRVKSEYEAKGYGPVWTQFADKITERLSRLALVEPNGQGGMQPLRGSPVVIKQVVNQVIGEAAVAAGLKFGGKDKGFFIESASGGDGSTGGGAAADGLTDGQRKVFNRMGVPIAEAQKTIGRLKFVN